MSEDDGFGGSVVRRNIGWVDGGGGIWWGKGDVLVVDVVGVDWIGEERR
ncbi:hypothetical protein [Paenibacillus xylanexedens]|nr:hypothetical protein [Paenibacillus xylanexedens]